MAPCPPNKRVPRGVTLGPEEEQKVRKGTAHPLLPNFQTLLHASLQTAGFWTPKRRLGLERDTKGAEMEDSSSQLGLWGLGGVSRHMVGCRVTEETINSRG